MVFALDLELRVSIRVFCVDPCPNVFGGMVMGSKKAHSDTAHSWKAREREHNRVGSKKCAVGSAKLKDERSKREAGKQGSSRLKGKKRKDNSGYAFQGFKIWTPEC
jgi:hypothetical protein